MINLPTLRPVGRHKAYYDELKAIDAAHGAAIEEYANERAAELIADARGQKR